MRHFIIASALFCFSAFAHAQMSFNSFAHGGTGCPQNTVSFSPSPDGQSVSVLFDAFQAQVPQVDGNNDNENDRGRVLGRRQMRRRNDVGLQHKQCTLAFSVDLPDDQMVEALEISVFNRGATILDQGVRASLVTAFAGHRGLGGMGRGAGANPHQLRVIEKRSWERGPVNEDWMSTPVTAIPIRSNCSRRGGERSVRFEMISNLEVEILGDPTGKSGIITMDSSDMNGNMKFRVITRPCGGNSAPGRVERRVVRGGGMLR